ncbi:UNVERIFIED_CONTAM: hypothetical protein Sindi_2959800 [Sesamum indicum]
MLDPCSGSDNIPRKPLQSSAQARSCLGRGRFPVLHTHREGIPLSRTSRFRPALHPSGPRRGVDLKAPAVSHVPRTGRTCPGRWPIASSPDLSDAEHTGGYEASASVCPESKRSALRANDARHRFGLVPCGRRGRYSLFDGTCYSDNRSNSRANTCNKPRLLEGMHLLDKRSTRAPPVAAMIHDNSTDRTALVPATHHSNFCPINFRWVRFRRGSLRNGYHIQGRQQARKLPNPDTGRIHWRASLVPALIFREANGAADHLAKDAASRQLTRVMYQEDITGVLRGIIRLDKMGHSIPSPVSLRSGIGERLVSALRSCTSGMGMSTGQFYLLSRLNRLVVGPWVWAGRSASGVHRSSRPFCRRCAPGLNWPGRASGAVTLKKLECSKQAYALYTLAWDNIIGFRSYYVGLRDRTFAKDVFINQERKLGARRRSDTVLVSTINDADQGSADVAFRTPPAPYEKSKSLGSGGSMVARLKLKGIDGRAPPGVEPAA